MNKLLLWVIGSLVVAGIAVGIIALCENDDNYKKSTDSLVDQVWNFSQSHPEGFTLDIRTMEEPTEGIAVSYACTHKYNSYFALRFVIEHALKHDGYVGGWYDSESNQYFFDSTRLFPEDQMEEAIEFARIHNQIAIYIISSGKEIRIEKARKAA